MTYLLIAKFWVCDCFAIFCKLPQMQSDENYCEHNNHDNECDDHYFLDFKLRQGWGADEPQSSSQNERQEKTRQRLLFHGQHPILAGAVSVEKGFCKGFLTKP